MLSLLKAYKRLIAFGFTVLAIVQLPKDVQDLPEAARPWWKFWQMVDQNTALWAALLACGIWISWTDLRPLWFKYRGPRFSARHAAILQELADQLAEVKQLATTRLTSLAKVTDTLKIEYYVSFREAGKKAMRMADQIAYDRSTYDTVKDYLHL